MFKYQFITNAYRYDVHSQPRLTYVFVYIMHEYNFADISTFILIT